jgi:hypothetical protein
VAPGGGRVELTDPAAIDAAADLAGREPLGAVVYAAGRFDWADADRADPDVWSRLVGVNLTAAARARPGDVLPHRPVGPRLPGPAEQAILRATGGISRPLFRFPFGDVDSRVLGTVNGAGHVAVRWTVDTLGWQGTSGGQGVATVVSRVLGGARAGEIVLMHVGSNPDDGSTLDAAALPQVIAGLRARGYGFGTLDALLG